MLPHSRLQSLRAPPFQLPWNMETVYFLKVIQLAVRQAHLFWIHSDVTITSVSLRMRNKGLIIINNLFPSFCQFVLYVLFIARKTKQQTNKHKAQKTVTVCMWWKISISPVQNPLPKTLTQCQWWTTGICLWALRSPLKHPIFQRSGFFIAFSPRCAS